MNDTADTRDTPPQIVAANNARVEQLAQAAALDDVKLARSVRVVRHALRLGRCTINDLTDEPDAAA